MQFPYFLQSRHATKLKYIDISQETYNFYKIVREETSPKS